MELDGAGWEERQQQDKLNKKHKLNFLSIVSSGCESSERARERAREVARNQKEIFRNIK